MLDPDGPGEPPHASASRGVTAPYGPPPFSCVHLEHRPGAVRLIVSGEVDIASAGALDRELECGQVPADLVVLDVRQLDFLDCSGVFVLRAAAERARASGRRFIVLHGSPLIDLVLELTVRDGLVETSRQVTDLGMLAAASPAAGDPRLLSSAVDP